MGLLELIVIIAVAGLLIWAITQIPMPEPFRKAIYVIAVVALVLYILQGFGLLSGIHDIRIGK